MSGNQGGPSSTRVVAAAVAGNALEFYDFVAYGFFAQPIAKTFFPSHDPNAGLLATFATFGVSFLARPVGAAVLGAYADRHGRRSAMTIAIVLMTLGTLALAVVPGERTIGFLAPLLVITARLVQGFSLGGEYGAATALLIEHDPARAGFLASFQPVSQSASTALASGIGWTLGALLPPAEFTEWGFRIAFALGTTIGPIGLVLRRGLPLGIAEEGPPDAPLRELFGRMPGRLLIGAASIAMGTGVTYLGIYLPTYAATSLGMKLSAGLAAMTVAQLVSIPVILLVAHHVQRASPVRWMLLSTLAGMLLAWPAFRLLDWAPGVVMLTGVRLALAVVTAPYYALQPVMLAGLFPARLRVTGLASGYTAGIVLFGAFAPLENHWLIHATGNKVAPAFFLMAMGVITLLSLAGAVASARGETRARSSDVRAKKARGSAPGPR